MFDGHHVAVPGDALPRRFLLEWTRKLDKPKGKSTTSVLKGISDDLETPAKLDAGIQNAPQVVGNEILAASEPDEAERGRR